jgi:predicted nucleic acid-binding protein
VSLRPRYLLDTNICIYLPRDFADYPDLRIENWVG